ncbi:MAG: hypothetical protein JXB88_00865 [Spirochaetales bacterium]|nr:hypothetical protein [Spirochaetales bacterium]
MTSGLILYYLIMDMRYYSTVLRILLLLLSSYLLLSSCALFNNKKVTLLTHNPEILAYVEVFNASQDAYHVEVLYTSEPVNILMGKGDPVDIIVGEWLASPLPMKKCLSLNSLLKNNRINPDSFYPELLQLGIYNKEQKVLPLNFTLSAIIYDKKTEISVNSDIFIYLENMKASSLEYNSAKNNRLLKIGFSPFWNDDFIYLTTILFGVNFRRGIDTYLTWDADALTKATAFLKDWINEIPGGYSSERVFSKKYLTIPPYQLIKEKQILYFSLNSRDLYKIPPEKFEYLDFKWLSYDNKIAVQDDILFIGIPDKSRNKNGGKAFISWLFNPVIQDKLLEINHFKKLDGVFGLAGGFSSLKEVNITSLPRHYPLFTNHIPLSDSIIFPGNFPDDWQRNKNENVKTWLRDAIIIENFEKKLEEQLNFFQK